MPLVTLLLVPALLVGPAAEAPAPPTAAELDALFSRMAGAEAGDRIAAAQALARAPASGFVLYVARLERARATKADTYRTIILEAWGQVPNPSYAKDGNLWLRKPDPPWRPPPVKKGQPRPRRPPLHDAEATEWLGALGNLDLEGNPALAVLPDRVAARAEALETVALLRAIAATGRGDAVRPLFDFAFALDGVFRDECGRMVRALGAQAIPGLVQRMRAPGEGLAAFRRRRYASYQLDRMDRAQPFKAIATAPDDRIRADIIHAYGEVRAIDAVDAILGQIDASSRMVRREARWAWLRYVTGPPPPPPPKRHRKLAGGAQESDEKEDYLSQRELALLALVKKVAEIHGDPDCARCARGPDRQLLIPSVKSSAAETMTRELFEHYDRIRAASWDAEFEAARARGAAGDLDGAIAGFSAILAHDPLYPRRGEVARAFYTRGEALLEHGQRERGLSLLREAVGLDAGSPRARRTEARLAVIDAERRLADGIDASDELRRALELDPENAEARAALARIEGRHGHEHRVQESIVAAGALALLLPLLALWQMLRRPRPRADE